MALHSALGLYPLKTAETSDRLSSICCGRNAPPTDNGPTYLTRPSISAHRPSLLTQLLAKPAAASSLWPLTNMPEPAPAAAAAAAYLTAVCAPPQPGEAKPMHHTPPMCITKSIGTSPASHQAPALPPRVTAGTGASALSHHPQACYKTVQNRCQNNTQARLRCMQRPPDHASMVPAPHRSHNAPPCVLTGAM